MSIAEVASEVSAKLDKVREALACEITGKGDVCLTCSFQAEDVLLVKLAIGIDAQIPVLFLETGYHFAETYAYRDRMAREWKLNLINLLPEKRWRNRKRSMAFCIDWRRTSAVNCAKLNRCLRHWQDTGFGSRDCGAIRREAERRWKSERCLRCRAESRC